MIPLAVTVLASTISTLAATASDAVGERLRTRLEVAGQLSVQGQPIFASTALSQFYTKRWFQPAWTDDGTPTELALQFLATLDDAESEGLHPEDYHTGSIEALVRSASHGGSVDIGALVDLELLLTDAFLFYASHAVGGRVDPTSIDKEWHVPPGRRSDVVAALEGAIRRRDISRTLESLRPRQAGYHRLLRALKRYRELAALGGWTAVPAGRKLEQGAEGESVGLLRARLIASEDLDPTVAVDDAAVFDGQLQAAVETFQTRHGLQADGVVGPATLDALNVPVGNRIRQIELSLERWRWLPDELGRRHILVNMPSFELDVVADGETVMEMRVVVGKPYRQTPVFSAEMTYLVLSPYWHVPLSIAVQDILPELKKDPSYVARKDMKVFEGWGADAQTIDAQAIDWTEVNRSAFPYRFRQDPGPLNALGSVKFMFPNSHNVYLHDTPSRELFARPDRTFSSGCIRIEKPLDLAEYLLASDVRWTRPAILDAIERRVEQTVRLSAPVAVHLQYWTSWVDRNGTVHFRKDVYGRDERLANGLQQERVDR